MMRWQEPVTMFGGAFPQTGHLKRGRRASDVHGMGLCAYVQHERPRRTGGARTWAVARWLIPA